jgi:hypothetical protein
MAIHRDIAGSQQALRPGFVARLAPEAARFAPLNAAGGCAWTAEPHHDEFVRLITR